MRRWLDGVFGLLFLLWAVVVIQGVVYAWQVRALPVASFFSQLHLAHDADDWAWLSRTWWSPEDVAGRLWRVVVDAGTQAGAAAPTYHQLQVAVATPDHYLAFSPLVVELQRAVACRCSIDTADLHIVHWGVEPAATPGETIVGRDLLFAFPFVQWLLGASLLAAILAAPFLFGAFPARALGGLLLVGAGGLWCLPLDLPIVWWIVIMQYSAPPAYLIPEVVAALPAVLELVQSVVRA